jgi:hypothetical protein
MSKIIDAVKIEPEIKSGSKSYILINPAKRLLTAQSVFGSWKHRSNKEIDKKLKDMREGWERPMTSIL